jgi:hypothetical protein
MEQPIEQCRGERGVWEDVAPLDEVFVARDDRCAAFVALTKQLEEPLWQQLC